MLATNVRVCIWLYVCETFRAVAHTQARRPADCCSSSLNCRIVALIDARHSWVIQYSGSRESWSDKADLFRSRCEDRSVRQPTCSFRTFIMHSISSRNSLILPSCTRLFGFSKTFDSYRLSFLASLFLQ